MGVVVMFKRGYANGEKIIEVIEGNIDVVLYNEKGTSFYFYRFPPEAVIGQKLDNNLNIVSQKEIRNLLAEHGKADYQGLINELIVKAFDSGMTERYEM
jgi:hypothetical protein